MSEDTMNSASHDDLEGEEMLKEYDFSSSKPGRHRGQFKGTFIRVLTDGTEQKIKSVQGAKQLKS